MEKLHVVFSCLLYLTHHYIYQRADAKLVAHFIYGLARLTSLASGGKEETACHSPKHAENLWHSWINNPFSR
jgi:hypothetical protein